VIGFKLISKRLPGSRGSLAQSRIRVGRTAAPGMGWCNNPLAIAEQGRKDYPQREAE